MREWPSGQAYTRPVSDAGALKVRQTPRVDVDTPVRRHEYEFGPLNGTGCLGIHSVCSGGILVRMVHSMHSLKHRFSHKHTQSTIPNFHTHSVSLSKILKKPHPHSLPVHKSPPATPPCAMVLRLEMKL